MVFIKLDPKWRHEFIKVMQVMLPSIFYCIDKTQALQLDGI